VTHYRIGRMRQREGWHPLGAGRRCQPGGGPLNLLPDRPFVITLASGCRRYSVWFPTKEGLTGDVENRLKGGDFAFWASQKYEAHVSPRPDHPQQIIGRQLVNIVEVNSDNLSAHRQTAG